MRNILAFLAALGLTVLGVGYYLGWYSVKSTVGTSGHRSVNIDINTNKIEQDVQKGSAKIEKVLEKQGAQAGQQLPKPIDPMNSILSPSHPGHSFLGGHPVSTTETQLPLPVLPPSPVSQVPPVLPQSSQPVLPVLPEAQQIRR